MTSASFRILLVEDDLADARLLQQLLRGARVTDLELVHVVNIAAAVQRLRVERFAAVLLDLSLPDSSGFDSFARIRAEAASMPIIVLSGLNDEAVAVRTVRAGAQDYIVKGQLSGVALNRAIRYAVERQQLVLQLAQYTLKLQNHEASFRNLVANSFDGVLVLDTGDAVLFVNAAAETLLGCSAAALQKSPFTEARTAGASAEREITRGDGTRIPVEIRSAATEWQGQPARLVSLRDISQRRRSEEDQRQLAQMKDDFVARVSHELRTPLFAILGFLDLLRDGRVPDPERRKDYLNRAAEEAHRLSKLVNDLLDMSQLDPRNLSLDYQPFDMRDLVQETLATLRQLSSQAGLILSFTPQGALPITADRARIKQVLVNLVGNAIKFSRPGRPIVISAANRAGALRVAVEDQGSGIAMQSQAHLFEKFYQAGPIAPTGGSGLGLYISRTIIEAHGGHIGVDSAVGRGSTFFFSLPLARSEDKPA